MSVSRSRASTSGSPLVGTLTGASCTASATTNIASRPDQLILSLPLPASAPQHFEGVRPRVLTESGNAPQLRERLDRARRDGAPQIEAFPTELVEDLRDRRLGVGVVTAIEHRRLAGREVGVDHARGADA